MNFFTFFLISFSVPKYYLFIIFNALLFFFKNIRKFHLILFSNKKEVIFSIIIFFMMYSFFNSYEFSQTKKIGWSLIYPIFYLSFILNKNIFNEKNFLTFLNILFFGSFLYILYTFLISFIIGYPVLRNGLIHPNQIILFLVKEFLYNTEFTYSDMILQRVNIAFLYLKIYTCVIAIVAISIYKKSQNSNYLIFLPILFITGLSFGSRSFAIFFIMSNFYIFLFNRNIFNFIILFINVLILIFNINFFINDKTSQNYLKFFKINNEKIKIINEQTKNNELNYSFFDINSLSNTGKRIPKNLEELSQSRLKDNITGFKAILNLKSKFDFVEYFKEENPESYFIKQKFFHNTYLNFFYLGGFLAFLLFIIINLNFFFNMVLNYKKTINDPKFNSLVFLFFSFQYIFFIETPLLTDKNILFIYLVFVCFSKKINNEMKSKI